MRSTYRWVGTLGHYRFMTAGNVRTGSGATGVSREWNSEL
jgi:hypothetical protein